MARRSLKPQLNQIRTWVRQGRTDAWVAHQLEVSVKDIQAFKRDHDLAPPEAEGEGDGGPVVIEEPDLRAEDDALVAAALAAEPEAPPVDDEDEQAAAAPRRRGRRGGRRRRGTRGSQPLEGTFDHGEEGYGLWLDPAVQDDPVYAEHWAGHRPVEVAIEPDRIVITRSGEDSASEAPEPDSEASAPQPDSEASAAKPEEASAAQPAEAAAGELDPNEFDA